MYQERLQILPGILFVDAVEYSPHKESLQEWVDYWMRNISESTHLHVMRLKLVVPLGQ